MKNYLYLLAAATAFGFGSHCLAVESIVLTAKVITGDVQAELPGATTYSPIASGAKFPVGTTVRTDRASSALVSLLPGFVVKISGNSLVTFSSVNYENTSPPRRSVLVDLHSGRMVAIVERYYPGRTNFFVQTGEIPEGNVDAKDKSVALGGAWDPSSCGMVSVTADSGSSRIDQIVGSGSWTEANGTTSQVPGGEVLTDDNGNVSNPVAIGSDPSSLDDRTFGVGAIRDAESLGLIDPSGCPGFSQFPVPGGQGLNDAVLGRPFNVANASIIPGTGSVNPANTSTTTPGGNLTPAAATPTPTPTPIISPSSLPPAPPAPVVAPPTE